MQILMVLASRSELGSTGKKTGFWLGEVAAPYYVFQDSGPEITLASPNGSQPSLDPKSAEKDFQTAATERFSADREAQKALAHTSEESAVGLTDVVPFLVEDELQKNGGNYSKSADWQSHSVRDGNLITGQNPASSEAAAKAVLEALISS